MQLTLRREPNPGLDLVRGLCALAVMVAHTEYWLDDALGFERTHFMRPIGFVAVEFFFVLSGVLLGPIILRVLDTNLAKNLTIFVVRRIYRTLPLYALALLIFATLDTAPGREQLLSYVFFLQNLTTAMPGFFSVSWSLSIEEWYYILVPGILIGFIIYFPNAANLQRFRCCMLLLIGFSFAARIFYLLDFQDWDQEIRKVVVIRLDAIALGALLSSYDNRGQRWASGISALLLVTMMLALGVSWSELNALSNGVSARAALALMFSVIPVCIFFVIQWVASGTKGRGNVASRFFADISYPLYLFHVPVLICFQAFGDYHSLAGLTLYFASSILVAYALHRLIERPIMAIRPHFVG